MIESSSAIPSTSYDVTDAVLVLCPRRPPKATSHRAKPNWRFSCCLAGDGNRSPQKEELVS